MPIRVNEICEIKPGNVLEMQKKGKICMRSDRRPLLIYVDPQSYNNLSKYDVNLLKTIKGMRVIYVCSVLLDQRCPEEAEVRKIFYYNMKTGSVRKAASYILSMLCLMAIILKERNSVVHLQWSKIPFVDFLFVKGIQSLTGSSVVFTAHNVVPHGQTGKRNYWLGLLYRVVDAIMVHTTSAKELISARFSVSKRNIWVIPLGLMSLRNTAESPHKSKIREFCQHDGIIFCFFGRGSSYKGLDVLLGAWLRLDPSIKLSARLVVIGKMDPGLRERLKPIMSECHESILVIDEFVPEGDLYTAVECSDVIVFPYNEISQSGALLSVLGLRKPVVVSDLPGLTEPLKIGKIGWIFKGGSSNLANLLTFLVENPNAIIESQTDIDSWQAVTAFYAWERIGKQVSKLYNVVSAH